jgi:Carboxypeptidase regulatory-like domain
VRTPASLSALLLLLALLLAGCASSSGGGATQTSTANFSDLVTKGTATTGAVVGVVVDDAIRPVKDAKVELRTPDGNSQTKVTDVQGRFAFSGLAPGTYFLRVSAAQFAPAQTSAEVVAGVDDPPAVRIQVARLFSQAPYAEQIKFDGFLACSISFPVGTTCVNDYTRIIGGTVPGCEGGCLRNYNVSKTAGNQREYVTTVGPGWQVIVFEAYWEASTNLGSGLDISVSFFTRPDSGHFFGNTASASPLRLEFDVNKTAEGQQEDPTLINWQGQNDLFVFYNDGGGPGSVTVNQKFTSLQTNFYYGIPPDGWSFAKGDPLPF